MSESRIGVDVRFPPPRSLFLLSILFHLFVARFLLVAETSQLIRLGFRCVIIRDDTGFVERLDGLWPRRNSLRRNAAEKSRERLNEAFSTGAVDSMRILAGRICETRMRMIMAKVAGSRSRAKRRMWCENKKRKKKERKKEEKEKKIRKERKKKKRAAFLLPYSIYTYIWICIRVFLFFSLFARERARSSPAEFMGGTVNGAIE